MVNHLLQGIARKTRAMIVTGLVLSAGFMLLPTSTALANHNTCNCSGSECAGAFERWCCPKDSLEGCGCTFFTSCP